MTRERRNSITTSSGSSFGVNRLWNRAAEAKNREPSSS